MAEDGLHLLFVLKLNLETMAEDSLHIVVFPWLAFGHLLPFLELSKSLARRGQHISFISTPRNIQRLPKVPPQISHLIHFIPFPLPQLQGLPETAEATSDVMPEQVPYLKKAFDGLQQPFSEFIDSFDRKPDWIIQDFAQHWIPQIAAEADVPCLFFSILLASSLVFFGPLSEMDSGLASRTTPEQFTVPPPWVPFPSKVAFRLHEARRVFNDSFIPNISDVPADIYRVRVTVEASTAVIIRSCMELERDWLQLLPEIFKKPVIPLGLLLPPTPDERGGEEQGKDIIEWLDEQRSRSVVYVAFGSEVTLRNDQTRELAHGLELSGLPFLWAPRRPAIDLLPEGFEERTKGFGIVAKGWVPQLKILAHESVGGFLTHVGSSSIIESLQFGQPLVMIPIFIDQGLNARVMAEKGVGVEVETEEGDGSFTKEAVAKALRLLMVDREGEPHRNKAKEMRKVFGNRDGQEKYVDDFIQYLKNHKN